MICLGCWGFHGFHRALTMIMIVIIMVPVWSLFLVVGATVKHLSHWPFSIVSCRKPLLTADR